MHDGALATAKLGIGGAPLEPGRFIDEHQAASTFVPIDGSPCSLTLRSLAETIASMLMPRFRPVTAFALLVLSCGGGGPKESDKAPAKESPLAPRMHQNLEIIGQMRTALERGELEEAKSRATALHEHLKSGDFPAEWAPHLEQVGKTLTAISAAKDMPMAAAHATQAGSACGSCHAALKVNPLRGEVEPLVSSPLPRANFMSRHSWAAVRLWEGLIGPSDERWKLGADTLAETPPLDTKNMTEEMQSLATALGEISKRAGTATQPEERQQVYGAYLATCAACHTAYAEQNE